jgi:hypothetical protein
MACVRCVLIVLALLGPGCATPESYYCYRPASRGEAVADLLFAGFAAGVALSEPHDVEFPPPSKPRPTTPPLYGTVSLPSGERVPRATVTLRGTSDFVVLQATTDERGRFWFPMPLPPDWYTFTVDGEGATGQTRFWLHKRHSDLDLQVQAALEGSTD